MTRVGLNRARSRLVLSAPAYDSRSKLERSPFLDPLVGHPNPGHS